MKLRLSKFAVNCDFATCDVATRPCRNEKPPLHICLQRPTEEREDRLARIRWSGTSRQRGTPRVGPCSPPCSPGGTTSGLCGVCHQRGDVTIERFAAGYEVLHPNTVRNKCRFRRVSCGGQLSHIGSSIPRHEGLCATGLPLRTVAWLNVTPHVSYATSWLGVQSCRPCPPTASAIV